MGAALFYTGVVLVALALVGLASSLFDRKEP